MRTLFPTRTILLLALWAAAAAGRAEAQAAPASTSAKPAASTRSDPPAHQLRMPPTRPFQDRPTQYVLLEPFKYVAPRTGEPIIVPSGFVTDLASIPGFVKSAFDSIVDVPAIVHDFLYWRQSCSRGQADRVFFEALQRLGVPKEQRTAIRIALGIAGELAYRENGRERRANLPRIIPEAFREIPRTTWQHYRTELRSRGVALDPPDAKPPAYCRG